MYKFVVSLLIVLISVIEHNVYAQFDQMIDFKTEVSTLSPKVGDELVLTFKVNIKDGWYLYATDFKITSDLKPGKFTFVPDNSYSLVGSTQSINSKKKTSEYFGDFTAFTKKGTFKQKIKVKALPLVLAGRFDGMVCEDAEYGSCIPQNNIQLAFPIFKHEVKVEKIPVEEVKPIPAKKEQETTGIQEIAPIEKDSVIVKDSLVKEEVIEKFSPSSFTVDKYPNDTNAVCIDEELWGEGISTGGLIGFMIVAFLSGLVALLTPCVFPMIPMTVSFFTRSNTKRRTAITQALFYGFSIIAIYTIIGVLVASLAGPSFANLISTHWISNVLFFAIFLVFALSFFGLFEITLPSSWSTAMDTQADKGGWLSAFFMALTLVIVSFSCTGPIVSTILIASASGEILKPIIGMLGFAMAFALPFTLFAIFPSWLSSMPKSGSWLGTVKIVLGFVELALAFKFLSVADLVYHWEILDRDVYITIWIAIFGALALYLFGKLPLGEKTENIGVFRMLLGVLTTVFVVYLIPGLIGAPLPILSGYLPPLNTHNFNMMAPQHHGDDVKYGDILHFPHGLKGYFDYEEAVEKAQKEGKPILIDFTGHACVNCRKMEDGVWVHPEIHGILDNDYILLALYVDDTYSLSEKDWVKSTYDGEWKKTIGEVNFDYQVTRFNAGAQPNYIILDSDGSKLLCTDQPVGNSSVLQFKKYLELGIREFEKRHTKSKESGK